MIQYWNERTDLLIGHEAMECLRNAHVLVVGVGGVGAYAAEMLVRAGIGAITIIDADDINPTNINRQLPALHSTVGLSKVDVLAARFLDINPDLKMDARQCYLKDKLISELLDEVKPDFVVDAIDTITPKVDLIAESTRRKLPLISSMGAGAKRDVTKVQFAKLKDTYHCGLSRQVRKRLKKMGFNHQKMMVVFCSEAPDPNALLKVKNEENKKTTCGTISYMPTVFGCYLAEYVIRKLITPQNDTIK